MNLLSDVDGDEISLVKRAANKRRFLLLKGDETLDSEIAEILDVPWEREGALLDEIRKDGISDETVEKAVIAAVRLLKGVEGEFSPELIQKLGNELYSMGNPKLNTTQGKDGDGELTGSSSGAEKAAPSDDDEDGDEDPDDDEMEKSDFSDDQRKDLASSGQALPDGSYPIRNKDDLGNAIQAFGRAKDPGRAKAWITRRAKALGATSMLPDSWSVSKEDTDVSNDDEEERGTVETHAVPVQKEDGSWDFSGVPDESRSFYEAIIQKADKTESELAAAKEKLAKADDSLLTRSMLEKAARYNHVAAVDDLAPILKEASQKLDEETFEKLEKMLEAAESRVAKGDLFTELGRSGFGESTGKKDAYSQLVEKADAYLEKSTDLTQEAAFDRALRENPGLYNQYLTEHGMGVA